MSREDDRRGQNQRPIESVIGPFARLIDKLRLAPGEIRDEGELPYPKQDIVDALLAARGDVKDHPYSPAQLQGWLLELAQFQAGVGAPICDPAAELARQMTAAKKRHEKVDPEALRTQIEARSEEERWAARRPAFRAKVGEERTRLLGLLKARW